MKPLGSIAAVIAAVREDAEAEAETLETHAAAEVERIRALEASDIVTVPDREARLAAARQRAQSRIAHEDWEDTRSAVVDREDWLARALELGQAVLARSEPFQARRDRLTTFAAEGLARLPGRVSDIVVAEADVLLLGPDWQRDLAAATGRDEIRVLAGAIEGGCVVRTPDGRAFFDNTYGARARRFQAAWRSALADVYEQAISTTSSAGRSPEG
jgi:vacuolar-type H+-ATPase subunit E/Vma4